jgi:L-fucose isomerase-like protein
LKIGCYPLVSIIQEQKNIDLVLQPFLKSIEEYLSEPLLRITPADFKKEDILPVILIKSGGVEEKFKRIYQQFPAPYLLLAGCWHNSLPAALEIKTYLQKRGEKVEILHGSAERVAQKLKLIKKVIETKKNCRRYRVGVLGDPSDWLIASRADYQVIRKKLGIQIYNIPQEEMIRHIDEVKDKDIPANLISPTDFDGQLINQALRIYQGLKNLVTEYNFNAITVRCFEFLDFYQNTGCLALSLLNKEGIISGCEGDVPALLSMIVLHQLTDEPVFMANPTCVDEEKNEIIFAHCTVPLNMCESYSWKSHFESGKGVSICGKIKEGPVTIFKIDGNLEKYFLSEGEITDSLELPIFCRTQLQVSLQDSVSIFLDEAIANHHLIVKGRHKTLLDKFFSYVL